MRATEFITELFSPGKKNWEWAFRGSEEAVAEFKVGNITYRFLAYSENPGGQGAWEVEFKNADSKASRTTKFGLTKTGNSAEVMSIVADIMREFLQLYQGKVTSLTFTADEESRQSLYARMAKRLLPTWELTQHDKQFVLSAPAQVDEEVLDEMPLPTNWDPQQFKQQGTSYKSRLAYALARAKKLGAGSSRVAMTIEYEGRPTVLKVAKNAKGLAQNSVEADILGDGYASQIGILIPIIDYDEQNREPSWVHTELAQPATEKQLCALMGCNKLGEVVAMGNGIAGKKGYTYQFVVDFLRREGKSDEEIERVTEYGNMLADLSNSFDVELGDLNRKANWGLYKGRPVIIDVGFNSNVLKQYYSR